MYRYVIPIGIIYTARRIGLNYDSFLKSPLGDASRREYSQVVIVKRNNSIRMIAPNTTSKPDSHDFLPKVCVSKSN